MAIKSYLAFPHQGEKETLINELQGLRWCDVIPAENKELIVIVAETTNKEDEEQFLEEMNQLVSLDHYTLVSGFDENQHLN